MCRSRGYQGYIASDEDARAYKDKLVQAQNQEIPAGNIQEDRNRHVTGGEDRYQDATSGMQDDNKERD